MSAVKNPVINAATDGTTACCHVKQIGTENDVFGKASANLLLK